jgi:protoporphyrinogen oxidase
MKIGIIGAGITGLTIAHELVKRNHDVTLFERQSPGGLAGGVALSGHEDSYLDHYYHHIFKSDREILSLMDECSLERDLLWYKSRSGIISQRKIWPLGTPLDLLMCTPVGSLLQRIRMGLNIQYFGRTATWKHLDRITCRDFFTRRGNLEGYRNLWEPLLAQKFGTAYDTIPASFLWGRIHPRSQSRTKGREILGYVRGGFQRLIQKLVEEIRKCGGRVLEHYPAEHVCPGERPRIISGHLDEEFERIIWTISPTLLPELVENLPPPVAIKAASIDYIAATCLILIMNRRLSNFYWLNNIDNENTFGAVIEHTNLVSETEYRGKHILYIANYHLQNSSPGEWDREELLAIHLPSLKRLFPTFHREDIEQIYLFRNPYSSPLYNLCFAERIPPYQGWLPGVDICGMTQVYPEDRNMNNCIRNAMKYVKMVF